ncbi:peroxiredoxin (alkyl hydroperoxide reductase subunit C) [Apiospora saccharicola]|uniref:Peroxiredoxin (Alkyl hydroperoxide reductase subunit C) n=1 Tax=Apiospora saccharicola TaxID=335842 RepID=A0ABR1WGM6_9PEZI
MASRVFRHLATSASMAARASAVPATARSFHATRRSLVQVGDSLPNLEVLCEASPGNKVNLLDEFKSTKGLVIGVPAAFSPACSQQHVPGYMSHSKTKEILGMGGKVVVVSVNDAFVMNAWHDQLDPVKESGIRFLGDPTGDFTRALDLGFDAPAVFGGMRGKRYALVIEDGKVKEAHVEPDNTGTNVSLAEKVLG